jgi:choline dehydrogenase-like flavoprotein
VSLSTLHLMGSCPMGGDPARSVADSLGRVRGAEGLWLADSSMLPGPTVVNPQGTIMAMARRTAEHCLERMPRRAEV